MHGHVTVRYLHSIMMYVTLQRFDQSAKQVIVGHTTTEFMKWYQEYCSLCCEMLSRILSCMWNNLQLSTLFTCIIGAKAKINVLRCAASSQKNKYVVDVRQTQQHSACETVRDVILTAVLLRCVASRSVIGWRLFPSNSTQIIDGCGVSHMWQLLCFRCIQAITANVFTHDGRPNISSASSLLLVKNAAVCYVRQLLCVAVCRTWRTTGLIRGSWNTSTNAPTVISVSTCSSASANKDSAADVRIDFFIWRSQAFQTLMPCPRMLISSSAVGVVAYFWLAAVGAWTKLPYVWPG